MQLNTHARLGAPLLVIFIIAVMLYSKSHKFEVAQDAGSIEMTGSISR